MYNISEQIDKWTEKLAYYESKESILKQRIADAESNRESVNKLPVGSPKVDEFYKQLNGLYTQLFTLPSKISRCREYISTLKYELQWN